MTTRANRRIVQAARTTTTSLLALLLALFMGTAFAQDQDASAQATVDPEEPVIELGEGETVTQEEFAQEFDRAMRMLALQQGVPYTTETREAFDRFRSDFLIQYATQQALVREAEERGITVSDEELDERIAQVRESFGGEEAFQQALQEFGYGSIDEYREAAREGLVAQRVVDAYSAEIQPTEEDVQAFFDENQAEHFPERSLEEVRAEVERAVVFETMQEQFEELRAQYDIVVHPDRLNISRAEFPNATEPEADENVGELDAEEEPETEGEAAD